MAVESARYVVSNPDADGVIAYVTASTTNQIVAVDLEPILSPFRIMET